MHGTLAHMTMASGPSLVEIDVDTFSLAEKHM